MAKIVQLKPEDAKTKFADITRRAVFASVGADRNPLDVWVRLTDDECRTTKEKGDLFEILCKEYLVRAAYMERAWLLSELPEDLRKRLGLRRNDMGIDIIALDKKGIHHAVQAKFRGRRPQRGKFRRAHLVSWKEICTFDTLARRTGPYGTRIVITTADGVRRVGRREAADRSVCYRGLSALAKTDFWRDLANMRGHTLGETPPPNGNSPPGNLPKPLPNSSRTPFPNTPPPKDTPQTVDPETINELYDISYQRPRDEKRDLVRQKRKAWTESSNNEGQCTYSEVSKDSIPTQR